MTFKTILWASLSLSPLWAQTSFEARTAAKEATLLGLIALDNQQNAYKLLSQGASWNQVKILDRSTQFKKPLLKLAQLDYHSAELLLDLRNEPLVISFPKEAGKSIVSAQLSDWLGHQVANFGTLESNKENLVLAGPDFNETLPPNAGTLIKLPTALGRLSLRFQSSNPEDKSTLNKYLSALKIQKFSVFAARKTVKTYSPWNAAPVDLSSSLGSLGQIVETIPWWTSKEDQVSLDKMTKGGLILGKKMDFKTLSPEMQKSYTEGFDEALREVQNSPKYTDLGFPLYGSKADFKTNTLKNTRVNFWGGLGHANQYSLEIPMSTDGDGRVLDGNSKRYTLRLKSELFDSLQTPWSITLYDQDRNVILAEKGPVWVNPAALAKYAKDSKGDIMLYLQFDKPNSDLVQNWLPIPEGRFSMVLRFYTPKTELIKGTLTLPSPRSFPRD